MKVKLDKPRKITVATEEKVRISEFEILQITDTQDKKVVYAFILVGGFQKNIKLWEGDDYDKVGDWTQQEAEDRIIEIL